MTLTYEFAFSSAIIRMSGLFTTDLFIAGLVLLIAIMFHFLPNATRRDIFFSVTVDPAYRATLEARRAVRRYRVAIWIHTLVALGLVWLGLILQKPFVPVLGVFWLPMGAITALFHARTEVMLHSVQPSAQREATLEPRSTGIGRYRLLQLGPFAILATSAVYIRLIWDRIPESFPVHWGLNGEPNGWATRSFFGIYGPWLIGLTICAGLAFLSYLILHRARQVRASGPSADAEIRFRRLQAKILLALEYFVALIFNGVPFHAVSAHPEQMPNVSLFLLATLALIVIIFATLIRTGQGGANLMRAGSSSDIVESGAAVGDRTPDLCWKAGMFYVNRQDPALIVEKRFGFGYTLNFGHPAAWLLLVAILIALGVIPVVIAFLSTHPH
jgi:uncharacterized membrane protein